MVVIDSALHCALTAASMTRMTSLTYILLVSFLSNVGLIAYLDSNWQDGIAFIGRHSMRFEVKNIGMDYLTLVQALTKYHISHFGH